MMPGSQSGSPVPDGLGPVKTEYIPGIPCVAITNTYNAPVHIDVGGTIYTSSLETLTASPDSKLNKLFTGTIPIVLDTLKQHYFLDRDGPMFGHILNFLRNKRLHLPTDFSSFDLLIREAQYFEIQEMIYAIHVVRREREGSGSSAYGREESTAHRREGPQSESAHDHAEDVQKDKDCIQRNYT